MNSNPVGAWSAKVTYATIPESEAVLVFESDGTGWFEIGNAYKWKRDVFEWQPASPGWIVLSGTKRLEPHIYTRQSVEGPPSFNVEHLPYEIREGADQKRELLIAWPEAQINSFQWLASDADTRDEPIDLLHKSVLQSALRFASGTYVLFQSKFLLRTRLEEDVSPARKVKFTIEFDLCKRSNASELSRNARTRSYTLKSTTNASPATAVALTKSRNSS